MRAISPGDLVVDHFPAIEDDGYSKRSGLTGGDFTAEVFKDGVVDALSTTITEIGSTGEYKLEYTPPSTGVWVVRVLIDFSKEIWVSTVLSAVSLVDIKAQVDKIDINPTIGPAAVTTGSLMDRMMNKDGAKDYNQGTDSLQAIRDREG
jgi:hypothetical protein